MAAPSLPRRPELGTTRRVIGWALGIAFATRAQSLAFLPAIATAPLLLALFERRWSAVRPFAPLYGILAGADDSRRWSVQAARGLGPTDLLGAYSIVGDGGYDAGIGRAACGCGISRS